jgi:hypothetical protein
MLSGFVIIRQSVQTLPEIAHSYLMTGTIKSIILYEQERYKEGYFSVSILGLKQIKFRNVKMLLNNDVYFSNTIIYLITSM